VTAPAIPAGPAFLVQLRKTQQAVRTRLDAELASSGLTLPQYTVLALLEAEGGLSSSELARASGVTAQTMNVLVTGLNQCGLVARGRHPDHGRILPVTLTTRGRLALRRGRRLALRVQEELLGRLSDSERARLMRSLAAVEQTCPRPQQPGANLLLPKAGA
jgi:DNA-binding MarR family transcriptional regulator